MRGYVYQIADCSTFTDFTNTQSFITSGQHRLEVMAEEKQTYISATILNITVTYRPLTTIRNIQRVPRWRSCSALSPPGSIKHVAR